MKRLLLFAAAASLCALAGCAQLTKILDAPIPTAKLEGLVTTANTAITTADGYVTYCTPNPAPAGCDDAFIQNQVSPDIDKLQKARDAAQSWIKTNNGKTFAPATIYDGLSKALSTVQGLGLSGATK